MLDDKTRRISNISRRYGCEVREPVAVDCKIARINAWSVIIIILIFKGAYLASHFFNVNIFRRENWMKCFLKKLSWWSLTRP